MTEPFDPNDPNGQQGMAGQSPYGFGGLSPYGFGSIMRPWQDPEFRRQAAFDAITNAGLGLIQSSGPSPVPVDLASSFGNLMGGAAQGMQGSYGRYLQRMQAGMQLQNMALQQQMYPAMLQAMRGGSSYDPWGGQAPQDASQPAQPSASGGVNDNNVGNVRPPGSSTGFQQPPDFNSGVALAVNTARSYPAAFNGGKPMDLIQIGQHWAPAGDGNNDPKQWAINVSQGSGLPLNEPLNLTDPIIAAKFARGVHAAEKGGNVARPVGDYMPGVQLAQSTQGQSYKGGGSAAPQDLPMPKPPDLSRYAAMKANPLTKGMAESLEKSDTLRYQNAMDRWKANMELRGIKSKEANEKVTPEGNVNQSVVAAETAAESAKRTGEAEAHDTHVFGGNGWQNKSPEDLRKTADPVAVSVADQVQSGLIKLEDVQGVTRSGGIPITKNDITALGSKLYGKDWDPRMAGLRNDWMKNATTGDTSKLISSFNTVYQHLDQGLELYKGIQNGDSTAINAARKWLYQQTGQSEFTNLDALGHALGTEIARVIKNGPLNEGEVTSAVEQLESARAPKQFYGATEVLRHAIDARWASNVSGPAARVKAPQAWVDSLLVPEAKTARDRFDANQQAFTEAQKAGVPAATANSMPSKSAIDAEMKRRGLLK